MTDTTDLRPLIRAALEAGDKSGGVMTRDGEDVTIYTADAPGIACIHGCVGQAIIAWIPSGRYSPDIREHHRDLIPRPAPKRRVKGWLNVYDNGDTALHETRERADRMAMGDRIACIEIDVEEGEGL